MNINPSYKLPQGQHGPHGDTGPDGQSIEWTPELRKSFDTLWLSIQSELASMKPREVTQAEIERHKRRMYFWSALSVAGIGLLLVLKVID